MDFTNNWFAENGTDKVFEEFVVPRLAGKPGVQWLEIGSFEGRSALWCVDSFLQATGSRIWCVDPWQGWASEAFERFKANTQEARAAGKLEFSRMESFDWLVSWAEEGPDLDGAFIDGNHEAREALLEGLMVFKLLKPGGLIVFDDYIWDYGHEHGNKVHVARGIDAFLEVQAPWIEVLHKDRHVVVSKK